MQWQRRDLEGHGWGDKLASAGLKSFIRPTVSILLYLEASVSLYYSHSDVEIVIKNKTYSLVA